MKHFFFAKVSFLAFYELCKFRNNFNQAKASMLKKKINHLTLENFIDNLLKKQKQIARGCKLCAY